MPMRATLSPKDVKTNNKSSGKKIPKNHQPRRRRERKKKRRGKVRLTTQMTQKTWRKKISKNQRQTEHLKELSRKRSLLIQTFQTILKNWQKWRQREKSSKKKSQKKAARKIIKRLRSLKKAIKRTKRKEKKMKKRMSRSQRRKIKNQAKAHKNSNDFDKKRCQKQVKKIPPAKNDIKNSQMNDFKGRKIEKIAKGKKKKLKSKCLVKYCPSDCNSNFEMTIDTGLPSTKSVHHKKSNSIKSISSCHQGLVYSSPVFPYSLLLGTSELSYALTQGMPYEHAQDSHRNMINYSKDNHAAITRGGTSNRGTEMASRHWVSYQSRQQTSSSIRHATDTPKTPSRYGVHEKGAEAAAKQRVFYQHEEQTSSGIKHPSSQTDTLTRGGGTLEKIQDLSSQKVMKRRSELALRANTKITYSRQTTQGGVSIPEQATQPTEALYLRQGDQRTAGKLTCSKEERCPATGQASENGQPPHGCDESRYQTCQNPKFIDVLSDQTFICVQNLTCNKQEHCPATGQAGENDQHLHSCDGSRYEIFCNANLRKDKEFTVSEQTLKIFGNEHLPNGNEFIAREQTEEAFDNEHLRKDKDFIAIEQTHILYNEHFQKGKEFIVSEQTGEVLDNEHLEKGKESVASEQNDKVIVGRASLEDMELQKADEAVDSEQTEEILVGRARQDDMESQKAEEAIDSEQIPEAIERKQHHGKPAPNTMESITKHHDKLSEEGKKFVSTTPTWEEKNSIGGPPAHDVLKTVKVKPTQAARGVNLKASKNSRKANIKKGKSHDDFGLNLKVFLILIISIVMDVMFQGAL